MAETTFPAFDLTVDGVVYRLDLGELTNDVELELFQATRLTVATIFEALDGGTVAPFMVAALVFLARRQAGDRIGYPQVSAAIDYRSEIDVAPVDDAAEATSPEALAAD